VLVSFAELLLLYSKTGTIDPVSILGTSLFIGLGYHSLRTNDRLFFKLQPAITAAIVGLMVGYLQFFGQPVLDRYWPFLQKILAPEQQQMLQEPQIHAMLSQMFTGLTFVMFLDAAWIAYAAKKQSQRAWVLVNVFGIFLLLFILVIGVVVKALFSGAPI
jgi:intracellular septation protein A